MKIATEKNLVRSLLAVLALASSLAPAISLAHGLDHLREQYAVGLDDAQTGSAPANESDAAAPCDLCEVLAGGRTAIAAGFVQAVVRVEPLEPAVALADWLLPRPLPFEPESQRAPPLS